MSEQNLISCVEALQKSLTAHENYIAAQSQVIRHMVELLTKVSDTLGNYYEWEWLPEVHQVAEWWKP